MEITTRKIQQAIGYTELEPLRKIWVRVFGDDENWPKGDTPLSREYAEPLLHALSQPTTRRTPEKAAIAARILAQLNGQQLETAQDSPQAIFIKIPDERTRPRVKRTTSGMHSRQAPISTGAGVTEKPQQKPRRNILSGITALDIVYATTIVTAIYGLWFNLKEMGVAFAIPYSLISLHALRMAKNPDTLKTARAGISAVVVLEILTFFIHLSMFNLRVVQIAKANALPFEYSYWGSMSAPFYIALVLSALFSGAGVYAVAITFSITAEKIKAKHMTEIEAEKRQQHYLELVGALEDTIRNWTLASGWNTNRPEVADALSRKYAEILSRIRGEMASK